MIQNIRKGQLPSRDQIREHTKMLEQLQIESLRKSEAFKKQIRSQSKLENQKYKSNIGILLEKEA
jgi:hypothetical protein